MGYKLRLFFDIDDLRDVDYIASLKEMIDKLSEKDITGNFTRHLSEISIHLWFFVFGCW